MSLDRKWTSLLSVKQGFVVRQLKESVNEMRALKIFEQEFQNFALIPKTDTDRQQPFEMIFCWKCHGRCDPDLQLST